MAARRKAAKKKKAAPRKRAKGAKAARKRKPAARKRVGARLSLSENDKWPGEMIPPGKKVQIPDPGKVKMGDWKGWHKRK